MLHLETQYKNTSYAQKILPVKPSQYIVWEINHLVFKRQEPLKAGLSLTHSNVSDCNHLVPHQEGQLVGQQIYRRLDFQKIGPLGSLTSFTLGKT